MKTSESINTIQELDNKRKKLLAKSQSYIPFLIIFPLSVFLVTMLLFFNVNFVAIMLPTVIAIIISGLTFSHIRSPFNLIKYELKSLLLKEFMLNHHSDIAYSYSPSNHSGRDIIRHSRLLNADIFLEEDVMKGRLKNASFYLSEVHLLNETRDRNNNNRTIRTTVFKGLLFRLQIQGKQFPESQIESKPGFLSRLFSGFVENKDFGFWYDTVDSNSFDENLKPLFPFINYLIKRQGDVRIKTKNDVITIMIESDMKFLDDPQPRLNKSFLNQEYYKNIGKQINSLLYIVESFVNNLSTSEIEERLELKAIELIKNIDQE